MRIPSDCNLNCVYCYSKSPQYIKTIKRSKNLSYLDIIKLLQQAFELGCKHVSIVGDGEPFLYHDKQENKSIFDLINIINRNNASVSIFSNNTLIDEKTAFKLKEYDLSFIAKQNSLNPKIQDYLVGKRNASSLINKGLENLINAGFTKCEPTKLAIHTIICKYNYNEIPTMWRKWRSQNIIPYVQVWVPPSKDSNFEKIFNNFYVPPNDIKRLFYLLANIDKKEFGYIWDPDESYPIAAMGCSVVLSGCGISPEGNVQLCAYTENVVGNIREDSLKDILISSYVKKIRTFKYNNNGYCFNYGCRALTYNLTGDRFARDPFFWKTNNS